MDKVTDSRLTDTELFRTVVQGGYCIGCGACAAVDGSPISITLNDDGCYSATIESEMLTPAIANAVSAVCPFSDNSLNEDELGEKLFGAHAQYDEHLGYVLSSYAGYVAESDFRARGSSGGMGKWILCELLRTGMVDAVIEVVSNSPNEHSSILYKYRVLHSVEEASNGSKSVYYPVEMSGVLAYVRQRPGRYAIVGIPCFVKAVRLLARQEQLFADRIRYCVGLVCGHLKSTKYAEMIGWQFGLPPGSLGYIDFRTKIDGARANEKGIEVRAIRQDGLVRDPDIVQNLFGTNYNHGFFQYKACDFCDDVVCETSDITIGDAWLPEYLGDGAGTNIVVVRHPDIQQVIDRAMAEGRLCFEELGKERVIESQAGGFRQRREGLAYRLYLADNLGAWRPSKRVAPSARHISRKRKRIYSLRSRISEASHRSYRRAVDRFDFSIFSGEMGQFLKQYEKLYRLPIWSTVRLRRAGDRRWRRLKSHLRSLNAAFSRINRQA